MTKGETAPVAASPPHYLGFGSGAPAGAFTYELRFPGQFFDQGTKLHYNYFRD
jgi:hypothetical protein